MFELHNNVKKNYFDRFGNTQIVTPDSAHVSDGLAAE